MAVTPPRHFYRCDPCGETVERTTAADREPTRCPECRKPMSRTFPPIESDDESPVDVATYMADPRRAWRDITDGAA